MKIKLAEAYLRRKELLSKLAMLRSVDAADSELLELRDEYHHYAHSLRLIEATIQQTTWNCDLDVPEYIMNDFKSAK